jgi:hypothetical protein
MSIGFRAYAPEQIVVKNVVNRILRIMTLNNLLLRNYFKNDAFFQVYSDPKE